MNVYGSDFYPELTKSNVQVYNSLMYRHWDTWEDGKFSHIFLSKVGDTAKKDLMAGQLYDCPQKPFGGDEDYIFNPDGKHVVYVTKQKQGTDYAISTNTDLFEYNIETGETKNLTEGMMGYDVNVESFKWSDDGSRIYFIAPVDGTLQLFEVNYPGKTKIAVVIRQITKGDFDVSGIVGEANNSLYVTRTDFNHAAEIYALDMKSASFTQVTHVNDSTYNTLALCSWKKRYVTTTDNKKMVVWVVLPPNFDSTKKYPTLLYCQGGPQSPLTQFYSFRWNFQLIASNNYVIVAPCRRGMPGFGTQWNEDVSKDWGGKVLQDYLNAIDDASTLPYVDTSKRGCVGASFGGFSVFALAGIHNHRFKTFLSHDGVFDFRSM